jgi:hypothetical protein
MEQRPCLDRAACGDAVSYEGRPFYQKRRLQMTGYLMNPLDRQYIERANLFGQRGQQTVSSGRCPGPCPPFLHAAPTGKSGTLHKSRKRPDFPRRAPRGNLFTLRLVVLRGDGEPCPAGNFRSITSGLRTVTAPLPSDSVAKLRFPRGFKTAESGNSEW